MTFGQTEGILSIAFVMLWWFFYFVMKMRADQKSMQRDADGEEGQASSSTANHPCHGCMVMQSAMAAAAILAVFYAIVAMELVSFSKG